MLTEPGLSPIVGRSRELAALLRVLDDEGPRVCFVYGMTGIGKSALLNEFARVCRDRGTPVVSIDCRAIEPTERGLLDALHSAPTPALTTTTTMAALPRSSRSTPTSCSGSLTPGCATTGYPAPAAPFDSW